MSRLRHPALLFWLTVVVVLASALAALTFTGGAPLSTDVPLDATGDAELYRARVRDVIRLGGEGGDPLAVWAEGFSAAAADRADLRRSVSGDDDRIAGLWDHASATAADLADAAAVGDHDRVRGNVSVLLSVGDDFAQLAAGIDPGEPAPRPAGGLTPIEFEPAGSDGD